VGSTSANQIGFGVNMNQGSLVLKKLDKMTCPEPFDKLRVN